MQFRFSSAIASFCEKTDPHSAMRLVRDAGFDSVDFPFSIYSVGHRAPLMQENWRLWVKEVRQVSECLSLPITQAHAAWLQDIPSDFRYIPPTELYYRTLEAAAMLECKHIVFHPVRLRERIDSFQLRQRIHDWNVRWFHDLVSTAERLGVYINLENTFDSRHLQRPEDPPHPYTTAEDMLQLLRDIGSNHIRLCLDTGHANNSGQDIPSMIRAFRSDLATVHLNDNYGYKRDSFSDLHLFPGEGNLAWKPIMDALKDIRFSGVMNIEPIADLSGLNEYDKLRRLSSGKDRLQEIIKETF